MHMCSALAYIYHFIARSTGSLTFFQRWKPAREHANPFSWPMLPPASADILAAWRTSPFQRQYINYNWIMAHHLEGTFHLTREVSSLFTGNQHRNGVADEIILVFPCS